MYARSYFWLGAKSVKVTVNPKLAIRQKCQLFAQPESKEIKFTKCLCTRAAWCFFQKFPKKSASRVKPNFLRKVLAGYSPTLATHLRERTMQGLTVCVRSYFWLGASAFSPDSIVWKVTVNPNLGIRQNLQLFVQQNLERWKLPDVSVLRRHDAVAQNWSK